MKVLIYDDKLFLAKNGILVSVDANHGEVTDAQTFETDKARTAEPDAYSTQADLNDFRVALGLEKVPEPEEVEEEEEEDEEEDDGK